MEIQTNKTNSELWAAIADAVDELTPRNAKPKGPGWFTTGDMAKRYSISETTARRRLKILENEGAVEIVMVGINKIGGRRRYFRLLPKKGKKSR